MQETWVWSLGQEDLLEKEMATHSSIFAWKMPWTEEPGKLQTMGLQRVGHGLATETNNKVFLTLFSRNTAFSLQKLRQGMALLSVFYYTIRELLRELFLKMLLS